MSERPTSQDDARADFARDIERPVAGPPGPVAFGSDAVAEVLRALDIAYVAFNPGASYRGLQDSLINHLGNTRPTMLLCLHEEHAVAIAHGWAKVTGEPMAVALHANVGLMHASMAMFNAWCDRVPMLVLGATGPMDAARRRPWIEWIHTARDQAALVRHFVKWDDQPASVTAATQSLLRAAWLTRSAPRAPVYVNLDVGLQEDALVGPAPVPDPARFIPAVPSAAPAALASQVADMLRGARAPLLLIGRVGRGLREWGQRVALAERVSARVLTDLKLGAAFPTDHPLHVDAPAIFPSAAAQRAIAASDLILSLDWVDLAGTLQTACGGAPPRARVVQVSLDQHLHNGWSMDHQGLPPVDLFLACEPDVAVAAILEHLPPSAAAPAPRADQEPPALRGPAASAVAIDVDDLARALRRAVAAHPVSLVHAPLSWNASLWPLRHPLDYLGGDGGGGVGAGPGISVGAALALRGSGRLAVSVCGDGDFLMGVTALWTAAHYRIPLLLVVANNQSFFNDEVHQEIVARRRGRPVENRWIGQRMTDPAIDLAALARAQGAHGIGPVSDPTALEQALHEALTKVVEGGVAVVDVRVATGYAPSMENALVRDHAGAGREGAR